MKKMTISFDIGQVPLEMDNGILQISLHNGMQVTIDGYDSVFEVEEWMDYHEQSDEKPELHIRLKELPKSKWGEMPFVHI